MGNLRLLFSLSLSFVLTSMMSATSFAQGLDPKDIKKMAERIVGHKLAADDAALAQIVSTAQSSGLEAAATLATQQKGFYNLTVKLMGLKPCRRCSRQFARQTFIARKFSLPWDCKPNWCCSLPRMHSKFRRHHRRRLPWTRSLSRHGKSAK
jgi:hypothetical protein